MNDWNVRNVFGVSGTTGMSGKTGKTGMSGAIGVTGVAFVRTCGWMPGMSLEGLVRHTDAFLEDLLAFYA